MNQVGQESVRQKRRPATVFGKRAGFTLLDQDHTLINIDEILEILRRGKWVLLLWLILCLSMAGLYLFVTAPEYVASSLVILEPRRLSAPQDNSITLATTLDSAQAESQIQVVKSERILSFVFDVLDLEHAPEFSHLKPGLRQRIQTGIVAALPSLKSLMTTDNPASPNDQRSKAFQAFSDRVGVRRIGQSYVLEIAYRAASAAQAARLANSITAAYIRDQIELKATAARRGAEYLQGRIADIKQEQDAALEAVREGVIPSTPFPDSDARVISAAREPLSKSYPQTLVILAFATASGLLIGSAILAVRHSLDRTIRSAQQLWRALGLECLSVIPVVRKRLRSRVPFDLVISEAVAPFSESLRSAYTSIMTASAVEDSHRSVGLVSWSAGEGKSTIAGNLAHFIAASGGKVVLIDADLRDADLSQALAPDAMAGLCEALSEHSDPSQLVAAPLHRNMDFVPARGRFKRYSPNLFLGSPEIRRFLGTLREQSDVVVDLPAMSQSSHAQAISRFLDGVVLIVQADRTTLDEVALAVRTLQNAQAVLLGVILNRGVIRPGA